MQVSDGVQLNLVDYVTDERRQQQVLREQQQAILRAEMQRLQRQQQQQQQQQAVQAMHQRSKLQTQMDHSTPPIPLLIGTSTLTTNQSTAHLPPPPVTAGNHEFCAEHVTAESSPGEPVVVVDAAQSTQNTLRNGSKTTETARPGARKRKATGEFCIGTSAQYLMVINWGNMSVFDGECSLPNRLPCGPSCVVLRTTVSRQIQTRVLLLNFYYWCFY